MTDPQIHEQADLADGRARRDQVLARIFRPGELVLLIDERYEPHGPTWLVVLLRQGEQGRWMRQRYRYDVPSQVLYFAGEQPVSAAEFEQARKSGRLIS